MMVKLGLRSSALKERLSTIKARVLAITLIPCIALLVVGAGVSGFLVNSGVQARQFASDVRDTLGPVTRFITAAQQERRLSTERVVGLPGASTQELAMQRDRVDGALAEMDSAVANLAEQSADELGVRFGEMADAASGLPSVRKRVDAQQADAQQVYEFYGDLIEKVGEGIRGIARSGIEAEIAFEQMIGYDLFRSAEAFARSHVLIERAIAQGLDPKDYHQLAHQMGTYHEIIERVVPRMTPQEQRQYAAMQERWFWKTNGDGDNAVMALGPGSHKVTFDVELWERAAKELGAGLLGLYESHSTYAAELGAASATSTLLTSLLSGLVVLLITAAAMVIALRLSRRLIGRLNRLREETLALSDEELPNVLERLRQGDRIDVAEQVPWLDYGSDEIGQVADAFNNAQRAAIEATVKEAETRKGVGAVFLNIAHRTQVIVHRQLKVLDKVERSEDDPDQLQLLFQLDHLATRSRRNAENLIILGGEQPGRQWRNPVSLREVVRSAISETEHYTRVTTEGLPDSLMDGAVIADLAHLLAELVDNATAFSPPQATVKVHGNVVGRGVVVEIEDQGLGMEPEQRAKLNVMLRKPPDFSVMALSTESRVGLFVVAQLAAKHGIKVALRESIYGGTTAVVLIPSVLIAQESTPHAEPAMLSIGWPAEDPFASTPESAAQPDKVEAVPPEVTDYGSSWRTVVFDRPDSDAAQPEPELEQEPADESDTPAQRETVVLGSNPPDEQTVTEPDVAVPAQTTGEKPPLPRRRRQANIAPQLTTAAGTDGESIGHDLGDAERSRTLMAAYQRGTLRGREADIGTNGHRS